MSKKMPPHPNVSDFREDANDLQVIESRRHEPLIPLQKVRENLLKSKIINHKSKMP
jgi:hypothetical protein